MEAIRSEKLFHVKHSNWLIESQKATSPRTHELSWGSGRLFHVKHSGARERSGGDMEPLCGLHRVARDLFHVEHPAI
jgi:hypothetical protein